ncbi:MAG: ATP-binding protein [Bacteroidales bacterium]|nr:ATP-binding protein [Bacteroidales bacterium]
MEGLDLTLPAADLTSEEDFRKNSEKNPTFLSDFPGLHDLKSFDSSLNDMLLFAGVGICHWSPLHDRFNATDQWYKNLNINRSDVSGMTDVIKLIHMEDVAPLGASYQGFIDGSMSHFQHSFRVKDGNGWKWLRSYFRLQDNKTGKKEVEIIELNFDISEFKNNEVELRKAIERAEESDRLKSAFISNISHEIRTPLNSIVGFAGMLNDVEDFAERDQYISIIEENTNVLLRLISDIIDFSRIEAEEINLDIHEIDTRLLLEELIIPYASKTSSAVKLELQDGLAPCSILADQSRLNQVLSNLINNAVKFTGKGNIRVGYLIKEEWIEFYVEDTGIGIPKDKLSSIFNRFVKLDVFSNGTGLGLSICKSLVEKMGGTIKAESELGVWSRFSFTLPYKPRKADGIGKDDPSKTKARPNFKKIHTILVAEDTDSNYALVAVLLNKEYHILRARNGTEAVKMHSEVHPDLILMDIQMPELNGLDATRIIRETDHKVPIVALTAFAFDTDKQVFFDAGGSDYMSKPIDPNEFRKFVREIF